ncbi:MAG: insulinase family protein [Bradymonadaceae bacterium]|nr:insulinase family protein [Lujinxingiaceae bacterium]
MINSMRLGRQRCAKGVLAAVVLLASSFAATPAFADEPRELIHTQTLANGLEVIVIPNPAVPIVTVELAVKNGAFTETPELNGLSHLYEHMFFKGNAVITSQEAYLKRMRELGIVFNGTTSDERVNYFFTLPADNLQKGLVFMYDATVTPKFEAAEFEKEKQVVLGEVDRNESSPYYWLGQALNQKMWHAYPERKDALGTRKAIQEATIAQMETMKKTYYVPNNSVIVIAGDVDREEAFKQVKAVFGKWKRAEDPFKKNPVPEHPPLKGNSYVVVEQNVQVPLVRFSWHGPSVTRDAKATYAADVLSYVLSQPTSRFYKTLVDSGITLGAGLSYYTQRYTGPISLAAQMQPEKFEEAVRALLLEVQKFADPDYFTDAQLENAKTILAVQDVYSREETSSLSHTVSFWWAVAGLDYYYDYIGNLRQVSREDIARYAQQYILGKPLVAGLLLSPEIGEQLGMTPETFEALVEKVLAEIATQQQAQR